MARNVLGGDLVPCSFDPLTGFYRDGCCESGGDDVGVHSVCAVMTAEFLEFSSAQGNDLSTPMPAHGFPGLVPGDHWCLCAPRWQEAYEAGVAPAVILEATHARTLEWCSLAALQAHARARMSNPPRIERCPKRIRAVLDGVTVVDSIAAQYVWRDRPYPTYFFPPDDVHAEYRHLADVEHDDMVAFRWAAMDHWFEEDEEVYVHPHDPRTRVDVLPSSRSVRVEIDGVEVAASDHPTLLFETGLPVRYYFAKTEFRLDLFVPSDRVTACPYKGTARYWSVRIGDTVHPDIAWGYDTPLPESIRIAGRVAFFNERVDLVVDGVHLRARFL